MAGAIGRTSHGLGPTVKAGIGVLMAAAALYGAWSKLKKTTDYREGDTGQSDKEPGRALMEAAKDKKTDMTQSETSPKQDTRK